MPSLALAWVLVPRPAESLTDKVPVMTLPMVPVPPVALSVRVSATVTWAVTVLCSPWELLVVKVIVSVPTKPLAAV